MLLTKANEMNNEINRAFGTSFQMEQIIKIKGLPMYITARRLFYVVKDDDVSFILVKVAGNEKYGVIALDKQRKIIEEKSECPVVFWFEKLTKYQRDSLIGHKIPFVADGFQLYLPFLGVAIQNTFKNKSEVKIDKMMPITQSLFLYLIYNCNGKKVMKKDAAEFLGVTKTSITRASEQLEKMGLIRQEMSGKEYYMWTELSGYNLFIKAKDYLINPIQSVITTEKSEILVGLPASGETALSEYSMINPSRIKYVAIDKKLAKNHVFEKQDESWVDNSKLVRVEFWKYDPKLFEREGKVDPISLYMTLLAVEDERLEGALEEMMEDYTW